MRFFLLLFLGVVCAAQSEREIVAATLILEAGGEADSRAIPAVLEVIRNRAKERHLSLKEVCLQRKQFSCWNNINVKVGVNKAKKHSKYKLALAAQDQITSYVNNANHYHAKSVKPYWANPRKIITKIGNHIFYKL